MNEKIKEQIKDDINYLLESETDFTFLNLKDGNKLIEVHGGDLDSLIRIDFELVYNGEAYQLIKIYNIKNGKNN